MSNKYALVKESATKSIEDLYGKDVIEAFRCEYGISLESFLNVMSELYGYALDKESPVISMNFSEFKKLMFDKAGLGKEDWNGLLDTFVYWPRDNWDNPQDGYSLYLMRLKNKTAIYWPLIFAWALSKMQCTALSSTNLLQPENASGCFLS